MAAHRSNHGDSLSPAVAQGSPLRRSNILAVASDAAVSVFDSVETPLALESQPHDAAWSSVAPRAFQEEIITGGGA